MSRLGGGVVSWLLLKHAGQVSSGTGLSQRELADRLAIGGPALVRHIDRMVDEGLIERRPDRVDRRVTRIFVTPLGEQRQLELAKVAESVDAELRSILTQREAATLIKALFAIEQHISTQHPAK